MSSAGLSRDQIRVQAWADLLKVFKALLVKEPGGPPRRTVALIVEPTSTAPSAPPNAATAAVPTAAGPAGPPTPLRLAQRMAEDLIAIGLTCSIHVGGVAAAELVAPPRRVSNASLTPVAPPDLTPVLLAIAEVVVVVGSRELKRIYEERTDGGQLQAAVDFVAGRASTPAGSGRRCMLLPVLADAAADDAASLPQCLHGFFARDFRDEHSYERAMTRVEFPPGVVPALTGVHPEGTATTYPTLAQHLTKYILRMVDKRIPVRNNDFVPRGDLLDRIRLLLDTGPVTLSSSAGFSLPFAAGGDSTGPAALAPFAASVPALLRHATGVGKTAVAIEYAWAGLEKKSYKFVRWFDVDGSSLELQFREFAADLHIADPGAAVPDLVASVYARLSTLPISYLVVFDGAPCRRAIVDFLPPPPPPAAANAKRPPALHHVLATSQYCDAEVCWPSSEPGVVVEVAAFDQQETEDLMRAEFPFMETGDIATLQVAAASVPLALTHVIAHLWKDEREDQVAECVEELDTLRGDLDAGTAASANVATWRLCVGTLEQHDLVALAVYRSLAYLSRPAVPFWVLQHLAESGALWLPGQLDSMSPIDEPRLQKAVQSLREMRLCRCAAEPAGDDNIRVNRFGQAAVRWRDSQDNIDPWEQRWAVMRSLAVAITAKDLLDRPFSAGVLAAVGDCLIGAVLDAVTDRPPDTIDAAVVRVLCKALCKLGQHREAIDFLNHVIATKDPQLTAAISTESHADTVCLFGKLHVSDLNFSTARRLLEAGIGWLVRAGNTATTNTRAVDVLVAEAYVDLAGAYGGLNKLGPQLCALNVALQRLEALHGPSHHSMVPVLNSLADVYDMLTAPAAGLKVLQRCLAVQRAACFYDTEGIRLTLQRIGLAASKIGAYALAVSCLNEALAGWQQKQERIQNHREIGRTMRQLGDAHCGSGNPVKGLELVQLSLKQLAGHLGKDDIEVSLSTVSLANAYGDLGQLDKQVALLTSALRQQQARLGDGHSEVARTLTNLANAQARRGQFQTAKSSYEYALRIKRTVYGGKHAETAKTLANYGNLLLQLGDHSVARAALQHSLAIREQHYGSNHVAVACVLTSLGKACGAQGDAAKQVQFCQRALEIKLQHYGDAHIEVARTLSVLADGHGRLGNELQQREVLKRVHAICLFHFATLEKENFVQAEAQLISADLMVKLARTYDAAADLPTRIKLLSNALAIQQESVSVKRAGASGGGSSTEQTLIPTLVDMALAQSSNGDPVAAIALMSQAIEIQIANPGNPQLLTRLETNRKSLMDEQAKSPPSTTAAVTGDAVIYGAHGNGPPQPATNSAPEAATANEAAVDSPQPVTSKGGQVFTFETAPRQSSLMDRRNIPKSMKPSHLAIGRVANSESTSPLLKRSSTAVVSQLSRLSDPTGDPLTLPGITQTSPDLDASAMVARSASGPAGVNSAETADPAVAAGETSASAPIGSPAGSMDTAAADSRLTIV